MDENEMTIIQQADARVETCHAAARAATDKMQTHDRAYWRIERELQSAAVTVEAALWLQSEQEAHRRVRENARAEVQLQRTEGYLQRLGTPTPLYEFARTLSA